LSDLISGSANNVFVSKDADETGTTNIEASDSGKRTDLGEIMILS